VAARHLPHSSLRELRGGKNIAADKGFGKFYQLLKKFKII
jgi:hypothetical protein